MDCPLCREDGGTVLWRDADWRAIEVDDPAYPGFTRIIWNAHAAEMSDIAEAGRARLLRAVHAVEVAQRQFLMPDKVNLASLGNMVAHVHWHVIPRWQDDRSFPDPIWVAPRREEIGAGAEAARARLPAYREALVEALRALN